MPKIPSFCTYPTQVLEQLTRDIEHNLIRGTANDLEVETFFYMQFELAERMDTNGVIDPRD